jgi:hypothetical protein
MVLLDMTPSLLKAVTHRSLKAHVVAVNARFNCVLHERVHSSGRLGESDSPTFGRESILCAE